MSEELEKILGKERNYVAEEAERLEYTLELQTHETSTSTCYEKAEILGWHPSRIIKIVFFTYQSKVYGFVFPELGKKLESKDLAKSLSISSSQAKKQVRNHYIPSGMEQGTCTPFITEQNIAQGLGKIFIHEMPELDRETVDISIGGTGEEAHKTSLHLQYKAIHEILTSKYGRERIIKTDLFSNN